MKIDLSRVDALPFTKACFATIQCEINHPPTPHAAMLKEGEVWDRIYRKSP